MKWGCCGYSNNLTTNNASAISATSAKEPPVFRTLTTPAEELEASATCFFNLFGYPMPDSVEKNMSSHHWKTLADWSWVLRLEWSLHMLYETTIGVLIGPVWSFLNMCFFKNGKTSRVFLHIPRFCSSNICVRVHQGTIMLRKRKWDSQIGALQFFHRTNWLWNAMGQESGKHLTEKNIWSGR